MGAPGPRVSHFHRHLTVASAYLREEGYREMSANHLLNRVILPTTRSSFHLVFCSGRDRSGAHHLGSCRLHSTAANAVRLPPVSRRNHQKGFRTSSLFHLEGHVAEAVRWRHYLLGTYANAVRFTAAPPRLLSWCCSVRRSN